MNFKPVPYAFDRDSEVLDLLHLVFSPWAGGKTYFDWKYKTFKITNFSFPRAWVIEDANRIIAFNGFIPRRITLSGKEYWVAQSFDTATHPDYKGKGLFGILQNSAYEEMRKFGISWVYGWTSEIGFKVFTQKMGWEVWNQQRFLMKVLQTKSFATEKASNFLTRLAVSTGLDLWNRITTPSVLKKLKIKKVSSLPDSANYSITSVSKTFDVAALRDTAYLNWRASNPLNNTYFLTAENEDGRVVGYAALDVRDDCLDIDDCLVESKTVLLALLAEIEKMAMQGKNTIIRFRVNQNHPWTRIFWRAGYFWSNTTFPLLGKKLLEDDFLIKTDNLHWTFFDRNE